MSFIAPWMLWGVAAASLPIILHLFYRSRYRTVPWAAMKFLLTSIEQTSRRLRFQDILQQGNRRGRVQNYTRPSAFLLNGA